MDLRCLESQVTIEDAHRTLTFDDPVVFSNERVLRNLLQAEEKYILTSSYFKCVQTDIKPYMRKIVAEWMWEVCDSQRCQENVFPLAMNYLDRFLSLVNIPKTRLQLIGSVCLFLASKLKESRSISAEKLCLYADHSITIEELMDWELVVLSRLKWDLWAITAHDFLDHILLRLTNEDYQKTRRHAQIFITLCATDFNFSMNPPSMIAAASVGAAVRGIMGLYKQSADADLLHRLHEITGIEVDCLRSCLEQIENVVNENVARSQHASNNGGQSNAMMMENSKMADRDSIDIEQCQAETPTDVRDIHF